jgi:catechol 2,3-dioxygenase-like lactoylglutathione lyase family enzyme
MADRTSKVRKLVALMLNDLGTDLGEQEMVRMEEEVRALDEDELDRTLARRPVEPGGSDLCFVWPGPIEGALDHLAAQGVDVEIGPVARFGARGNGTSVYFRDPDGSLLELISYDD